MVNMLLDLTASSINMIFYILVSFGFVIGVILMVAPGAYDTFNQALQKEYGLKMRFIPKVEDTKINTIDEICKKNAGIAGMIISFLSFVLLLTYK